MTDIFTDDAATEALIEARVADRVAAQLRLLNSAAPVPPVITTTQITPTSIAEYQAAPDEVTVQFLRFKIVNGTTSFMRGQQAGFPAAMADRMVASGDAEVVHRMSTLKAAGPRLGRAARV